MLRTYLPLFAFLLVSCAPGDESETELDVDARVDRIENGLIEFVQITNQPQEKFNISERLDELGIPGLSVAFAANGEIEWARAYGDADKSQNRRMTTDTYLLAGSISKPVAAIRALQLVEDGVFDLDENINTYLTSWQLPDNEFTLTEKVTLRRILTHTAGLTVWGFPGYDEGDEIPSVVDVLDGKGNTDPVRVFQEPGKEWMYSGGGYTMMQLAISDTVSSNFQQSLKKNVLDKMGMFGSTFENPLPDTLRGKAATGYRFDGSEVEGKWPIYPEMAAAGLWTTPSELIQYGIEIQKIRQSGTDGVLSHQTVMEMLDAESDTHGLGPSVQEYTFGHGGADEGFRAQLFAWKDLPYAVVVMANSDNGKIMRELLLSIAYEYELPGIEPLERQLADLTLDELARFAGRYQVDKLGIFEISVDGNRLQLSKEESGVVALWYPQSELEFFNKETGATPKFDVRDGGVISFTSGSFKGVRLDEIAPAN